jgi:hypothetical protein
MARGDQIAKNLRGSKPIAKADFELLSNVQPHVESHDVAEHQGAYGVAVGQSHCPIDVFRRSHMCLDHSHRFQRGYKVQTACGETGGISHNRALLANLTDKVQGLSKRRLTCVRTQHNLN